MPARAKCHQGNYESFGTFGSALTILTGAKVAFRSSRFRENSMFQVRIHGRGGQGVVTAAEMLAVAGFLGDKYTQAFPSFGSERMGAPVVAYCRIDEQPIRTHDPVSTVDCLVVQDPTLVHDHSIFDGLTPDSYLLVNTARALAEIGTGFILDALRPERVCALPATELARRLIGRPLPNTALLGGVSELTKVVPLTAVNAAIRRRFEGETGEANVGAATEAAGIVRSRRAGVIDRA